jgi:N-methylhydantoinase A
MDAASAAFGMCEVADEAMANAARVHAIESGKDVADRTLIATGGAAPLHAGRVAEKLGIARVVIPADAGVGSAVGFLLAPVSFEVTRSWIADIDDLTGHLVKEVVESMQREASATVRTAAPTEHLLTELRAHLRYSAQAHEIEVGLPMQPIADAAAFRAAFEQRYKALYGRLIPGVTIRLVSLTVRVTAEDVRSAASERAEPESMQAEMTSLREVPRTDGAGHDAVATYERTKLQPGARFDGPAIVVERQTTTVVPASMRGHIDAWGNLVMTRKEIA